MRAAIRSRRMFALPILMAIALCTALPFAEAQQAPPAAPPVEQIHNELRALKDRALKAVNANDEAALQAELSPNILFTAMNNERVYGTDGVKAYHKKMMVGANRIVQEMSLTAEADDLTTLYNNNTMGVVTGTSAANFKLTAGLEFSVPLRWTATMVRSDNTWKIAGLHFSANMFDNPLMSAKDSFWRWLAMLGIPLALLAGWFFARRYRAGY